VSKGLFTPDLLLDVPYIFEEVDEDTFPRLFHIVPVKGTPCTFNLYYWEHAYGWVYDDNISIGSAARRLNDAKKIYLNIQ